jgi:thiamine-monophosphate kinase
VKSLGELGELGLIHSLLPYLAQRDGELLVGAGEDDAAAWKEPDGSVTVATCDTVVEGIHFDFSWLAPEDVGWRALAMALGDLAAKGAEPTYGMVSLSAPSYWDQSRVVAIYEGMAELAAKTGIRLVGGDTTATPGVASLTVAALGRAVGEVVPRSAARAGWTVAVTGKLGAAGAALQAALGEQPLAPEWAQLLKRPFPRLAEGQHLCRHGLCCGDVSDGLLREMDKFEAAAGTGCELRLEAIPAADGVSPEDALASGEEVELVCVGPEADLEAAAEGLGCTLTRVGVLTEGGGVRVLGADGRPVELAQRGYDHFG